MAKVRYIEVVIAKLPVMMIHMNPEDKNFNDGCSRRLNVLKKSIYFTVSI